MSTLGWIFIAIVFWASGYFTARSIPRLANPSRLPFVNLPSWISFIYLQPQSRKWPSTVIPLGSLWRQTCAFLTILYGLFLDGVIPVEEPALSVIYGLAGSYILSGALAYLVYRLRPYTVEET